MLKILQIEFKTFTEKYVFFFSFLSYCNRTNKHKFIMYSKFQFILIFMYLHLQYKYIHNFVYMPWMKK